MSLVILSYQGRKTGRWRSLPCMYARNGQDLYVVAGQPGRTAAASSDPEAVAAGLRHYLARYPKAAEPLGVRVDAKGTPTARPPPPTRWSSSASTLIAASTNVAAARDLLRQ